MKVLHAIVLSGAIAATGCTTTGKTTGNVIDDTAIATSVKTQILRADLGDGFDANVEVYKGIVQLGGFVDQGAQAARLAEAAKSVDGVVEVDNQLQLRGSERSLGQAVDDGITTSRVSAAITGADFGDGLALNVDTYNGVVLLTGFVTSSDEKRRIEKLAKSDPNTRRVINGLYVVDTVQ